MGAIGGICRGEKGKVGIGARTENVGVERHQAPGIRHQQEREEKKRAVGQWDRKGK